MPALRRSWADGWAARSTRSLAGRETAVWPCHKAVDESREYAAGPRGQRCGPRMLLSSRPLPNRGSDVQA